MNIEEHLKTIDGNTKHDVANCPTCNPTFPVELGRESLEKVREFAKKEGWERKLKIHLKSTAWITKPCSTRV